MWTMVKFEYRKLWSRVSLVAVIVMCIISTFHTFVYLMLDSAEGRQTNTNKKGTSSILKRL